MDVPVVILGGGLAGLSAATALVAAGRRVMVLEGRGDLGGRARSFIHARTGDELDTGQHVMMGCYREMLRYLDRIGTRSLVRVEPRLHVELVTADGRRARLRASELPSPLHLASALLGHGLLDVREKVACLRVIGAVRARAGDPALDRVTVTDWLDGLGQSANAREALWEPLTLAVLNASPDVAPASLLATVLARAFLGSGDDSSIVLPTVGLSSLHAEAARRFIEERGSTVRLNEPIRAIEVTDGAISGIVLREGATMPATEVISSVPGPMLRRLLPESIAATAPFARLDELGRSPIVSCHVWLDRPVLDTAFVGFLGTRLHWAFDRARTWGTPAKGGHLVSLVVSGADDFAAMERDEIFATCWTELTAAFPAAREARVLDHEVIKEKEATFRARPGQAALRFGPATPIRGLTVAGDWTDTGLPATMEGACASGHAAAGVVLASRAGAARGVRTSETRLG